MHPDVECGSVVVFFLEPCSAKDERNVTRKRSKGYLNGLLNVYYFTSVLCVQMLLALLSLSRPTGNKDYKTT
jgi:hypothetical protein